VKKERRTEIKEVTKKEKTKDEGIQKGNKYGMQR
jgi:hypothetical protein